MYQSIDAQSPGDSSDRPVTRNTNHRNHPYYDGPADMPLFGEARTCDRVLNLIVGAFTALFVTVILVCAIAYPTSKTHRKGVNIYFALCLVLLCGSHLVLIYWYRQGDLEPRFRTLIYFNAFTIILLCICGLIYVFVIH